MLTEGFSEKLLELCSLCLSDTYDIGSKLSSPIALGQKVMTQSAQPPMDEELSGFSRRLETQPLQNCEIRRVYESVERQSTLLGGVAIEDHLHAEVPQTIWLLGSTGIPHVDAHWAVVPFCPLPTTISQSA